jgi:hypothetical protein
MTRDDFWDHISSIDRAALSHGDEEAAIAPLERRLESLNVQALESFEEHLSQCLFALDGEAFADESGESSNSDDAFLYARCYVVAQGRDHYEATLKKPKLMPKTLEQWFETLLYPHRKAWAKLTATEASEWPFQASVSYESGSNEDLWSR